MVTVTPQKHYQLGKNKISREVGEWWHQLENIEILQNPKTLSILRNFK